uniref:Uncharacterized protein n=1 Tax=Leersia perrieri TaxID=77586 RepID=A0A0D9VAN2_9ORYZ
MFRINNNRWIREGKQYREEMEKMRNGGFTLQLLCLRRIGILVVVLPSLLFEAAAAADSSWHPNPSTRRVHHGILPPPFAAPSPAPTAGADELPTIGRAPKQSPHFGFPLQPSFGVAAAAPPVAGAGGEGYPFIGSNPTVPLPTGMTDSSTVLPMPDRGDAANDKVVGRAATPVRVQIAMIGLVATISGLFLWGR